MKDYKEQRNFLNKEKRGATMAKHVTTMQVKTKTVAERAIAEKTKTTKITYPGLCQTCENSANCTFPRKVTSPVNHCEEFDDGHASIKENESVSNSIEYLASEYTNRNVDSVQGLCSNCENFKTCTFPKPEGGVWHCEEFR